MSTIFRIKSTKLGLIFHIMYSVEWSVIFVDFGSRLRELRIQFGLTQKQLADRIGVSKGVVSFYELRERSPSPDVLIKLAAIFHVTTDYLLGMDEREYIDVTDIDPSDIALLRSLADRLRGKRHK